MVQQVKDSACCRLQLQCGFNPRPKKFRMPRAWPIIIILIIIKYSQAQSSLSQERPLKPLYTSKMRTPWSSRRAYVWGWPGQVVSGPQDIAEPGGKGGRSRCVLSVLLKLSWTQWRIPGPHLRPIWTRKPIQVIYHEGHIVLETYHLALHPESCNLPYLRVSERPSGSC